MRRVLQSLAVALALTLPTASRRAVLAAVSPPCIGDCQGTGTISIDSLVTLVGVALGHTALSSCPLGVPEGAQVDVALIVEAVNNALHGCPAAQATPTIDPTATVTPTPTPTGASGTACPIGQHRVCHSGSGRGGGYRRICSCVANPPPVCVTSWGTQIQIGTSIVLYDVNMAHAPDTCSAHATVVSCDSSGALNPPNSTGYPSCIDVHDETGD